LAQSILNANGKASDQYASALLVRVTAHGPTTFHEAHWDDQVYVALVTFGNRMSDVVDNKARQRFELEVEGHLAMAFYKRDGGVITLLHTEVPPELNGKGVGARLVQGALDQVRTAGLKVVPQCPFVKAWIGKHPEYKDLVQA
jgi:hypothetical protein